MSYVIVEFKRGYEVGLNKMICFFNQCEICRGERLVKLFFCRFMDRVVSEGYKFVKRKIMSLMFFNVY